jgi:hypothetical protein
MGEMRQRDRCMKLDAFLLFLSVKTMLLNILRSHREASS